MNILRTLLILIVLFTFNNVYAVEYELQDNKLLEIEIAEYGPTRLSLKSDKINNIFAYPQDAAEMVIHNSGCIFVVPQQGKNKLYLTLISENETIQDLKLIFVSKNPSPVMLIKTSDSESIEFPNGPLDKVDSLSSGKLKTIGISSATILSSIWAIARGNIKLAGVMVAIGIVLGLFLNWLASGVKINWRLELKNLNAKQFIYKVIIQDKPVISLVGVAILVTFVFYVITQKEELVQSLEKRESREEISGVEQAVNPRAKWTDEVEVKTLRTELEKAIENKHLETKAEINDLHQKMSGNLEKQTHQQIDSDLLSKNDYQETTDTKVIEKSMSLQRFVEIKKDVENYVTSGSSAKAILLTGVVVGTGTNSSSSLDPIVLQLLNQAILYDEYKTDQIKKAILIGSCNGDVASERAKCRLETLSVINNTGDIIEKKVEGWLIGEDGLPGIKGMVVDKSSDAVRMAALNFVFSGIAKSLQVQAINQDMQTVQSLNSVTASQQEFGEAVKSGSDSGGSNTFDKLADFAIKIADAMSPVIVVDSGRVVDVVFKKGFDLLEHNKKNSNFTYISNVDLNVNQSENI